MRKDGRERRSEGRVASAARGQERRKAGNQKAGVGIWAKGQGYADNWFEDEERSQDKQKLRVGAQRKPEIREARG